MKKIYYHITSVENLQAIQLEGLKANTEGQIYLFSAWEVLNHRNGRTSLVCDQIALNQLGLQEFLVVEVSSKGIRGTIMLDDVGEITRSFQWVVSQKRIAPSYIKIKGIRKANLEEALAFKLS